MKKLLILLFVCFSFSSWAQFTNNGMTLVIESGATLHMKGTVVNQNNGTITNGGHLIVEGDLDNSSGTFTSTAASSKVTFEGNTNSTFTVGNISIDKLETRKSNADLNIFGNITILDSLDFLSATNSQINLVNNDLTLEAEAGIRGTNAQNYIATNGTGSLIKEVDEAGTFIFPVGNTNGASILTSDFTGSSFFNASIKVKVNPVADPNLPSSTTDYVTRHWEVIAENIGSYRNEVEANYLQGDLNGQEALLKGASYDSNDWSYKGADRINSTLKGTIETLEANFTGSNFYGKIDPIVYLQGSYNSASGLMFTRLADAGLIPLNAPYSDAPATAITIPSNAVDWVKLELRDQNNPNTIVSKKSGFLLEDGSMVDVDGTNSLAIKDAPTSAYVAVYHRNHLPIRSKATYDLSNPSTMDFTETANVFDKTAVTTNAAVKLLGGSTYGMWSGDVNGSNTISYNGGSNDRTPILIKVGFATPNNITAGYHSEDINLDGNVSYNGGNNDRTPVLINVGFATPNKILSAHID